MPNLILYLIFLKTSVEYIKKETPSVGVSLIFVGAVYLPHEEQEQTIVQLQTFVIPQLQSELERFLSEKPKAAVPIPIAKAVIVKYFFISQNFSFTNYEL